MKKMSMKYAKQIVKDYNGFVDVLTSLMDKLCIISNSLNIEDFKRIESEYHKKYQSDIVIYDDFNDVYYFTAYYKRIKINVLLKDNDISLSQGFEVLDESGEYQKTNVLRLFTRSSKRARLIIALTFFRALGVLLPVCSLVFYFLTYNLIYIYLMIASALLVLLVLIFYKVIINLCFKD